MLSFNSEVIPRFLAAAACVIAIGCTEELPGIEGTTSIAVDLTVPTNTGSPEQRLSDDERSLEMSLRVLDAQGELDDDFSATVQVYSHYLGSLTPELGEIPLFAVNINSGVSEVVQLDLLDVFGPTFLWAEDAAGDDPTYATGTTPVLWFRDPYLADISRPSDEMELDALKRSPLEVKQVSVARSRYGDRGRLVVTAVYAQGYTLSDVECQDASGTPPCVAGDYDSIYVFTFSRAEDESGRRIQRGHVVDRLAGSISEFNGLTEVNFPQTFLDKNEAEVRLDLVPEPVVVDPNWLTPRIPIEMERLESSLIAVEGATVCPLDDNFEMYSQWKLNVGLGCSGFDDKPINVITKGEVAEFSPQEYVGQTLPRVVGSLRPVNIVNGANPFNVWILYPRDIDDLQLPTP